MPPEAPTGALLAGPTAPALRLQAQGAFVDRERDVQRADPVALRLLSFVARRVEAARVLIVLAVRTHATSHDDTRPELERMLQELPAYPVALDGLSLDEVARYTELYRGQAPTSAMAERFHRLTGGNPLLVQQIAHTEAAGRQWDS